MRLASRKPLLLMPPLSQTESANLPDMAIHIRGLRKIYAAKGAQAATPALKGIDLDIKRGRFFGLLGPNGAGKSTCINIMAGLVLKNAGQVNLWGFDADANPRQARASIGVMPQEINVDPFFTPLEMLEQRAGLYGVVRARRRSQEILRAVGLEDQAKAYARALSGGMRRRLLLGKAMVHQPPILVLDEPTAGVDVELRQHLWELMRALNRQGVTIVLTTHYLEEAQALCDEIAIINRGELIACDATHALVQRIDRKTLLVRPTKSLARVPQALQRHAQLRTQLRPDGQLALSYNPHQLSAHDALDALKAANITIADLSVEGSELEQVFLQLTRQSG